MKRLTLSLFLLILSTITFAQHDMSTIGETPMNMSSNGMLSGLEGADLETTFLSMMIEHHKGAVDMAQWILERTQNADIKTAAEAVIAAQEPEIKQMTQWLQDWYGQGVNEESSSMMQNEMTMMMDAMSASENADVGFLEQMSLHHNSAIDMAQAALLGATHPELRELATNIIVTQALEIAQYQNWLEALPSTSQLDTGQDTHAQHNSMQHDSMQLAQYQVLRGYTQN